MKVKIIESLKILVGYSQNEKTTTKKKKFDSIAKYQKNLQGENCPKCKSETILQIIYGINIDEYKKWPIAYRENTHLGGFAEKPENRHCKTCHHRWEEK